MVPLSPDDIRYIDSLIVRINAMIAGQAAANDADFVDTYADSGGHDVCKLPPERWFEGIVPTEPAYPMHPNGKGEASMARSAIAVLSRPRSGSGGTTAQLTAVFSGRSRRARTELVLTTAPGYATRGVHTGSRAAAFRRAFPNRRLLGSGLFFASPRSHILFWVAEGRVRFVALVGRRPRTHPRRFTHDLRVALR